MQAVFDSLDALISAVTEARDERITAIDGELETRCQLAEAERDGYKAAYERAEQEVERLKAEAVKDATALKESSEAYETYRSRALRAESLLAQQEKPDDPLA